MVIDTSALIAVLQREPEAGRLIAVLETAPTPRLSAASLVEGSIVMQARYGDQGEREIDLLVQRAHIEVIPVTNEQADLARAAFRRFGKGRHAAGLNFGDCFAYTLSVALGEPLLFVGDELCPNGCSGHAILRHIDENDFGPLSPYSEGASVEVFVNRP